LAEKYEKYDILVKMYLEDSEDKNFTSAIRTIEEKIKPVREKVRLLQ